MLTRHLWENVVRKLLYLVLEAPCIEILLHFSDFPKKYQKTWHTQFLNTKCFYAALHVGV